MLFPSSFIAAGTEYATLDRPVAAPYLRRTFVLEQLPRTAQTLICGLGFYRLWVNGTEITKGHMAPYVSNPDHYLYYDSYDIAPLLRVGENVVGVLLGNGMQNNPGGFVWEFDSAPWRSAPKMAFGCELVFVDGSSQQIEGDSGFRCAPSPLLWDDYRLGEVYDARRETAGWNLPGYDDRGWTAAIPAHQPGGKPRLCEVEPIRAERELKPVRIWQEGDAYIYDFGLNSAGVSRLHIRGQAGQTIELYHGELIYHGKFDIHNLHFGEREQYRDTMPQWTQRVRYTCGGGDEVYQPSFTYFGFQYIKVTGITAAQATPELLTYVVMHSALRERGSFHCSDETLNALQAMTRNADTSNFYYFPTDCPHREKNGWTGDAALSVEHMLLNLGVETSLREWLHNIRAAMRENGELPGIVPTGGWGYVWGNGPAWDMIIVHLPYYLYLYRGDKQIIAENAAAMLRYIHYLTTKIREDGLIAFGLGDWCAPLMPPKSPLEFTDTVVCLDLCEKAAYLFGELGLCEQAEFVRAVATRLRQAVRATLVDFDTMTVSGNCQTSQAMAIYYRIFTDSERPRAMAVLLRQIAECDNHIDSGILGLRVLFHLLSEEGYSDLAHEMITKPTIPSYGNWVALGMTSLGEFFDERERRGRVYSLNHHFFGDISSWMIKQVAGIQLNPYRQGVNQLLVAPHFLSRLTFAEATHTAPLGQISVRWERTAGAVSVTVSLPAGMTGSLQLPPGYAFADGSTRKELAAQGTYQAMPV
ncbi:MAG: family 78 glycoside hydrolase catalytic domain [Eubacteriales bacterium]